MTTYSQRSELETKAQALAKQQAMWQSLENACLGALGMVALGLLISAYFGV
jgi:FtsZ-binding cell division protein ZapB